eukprot:CAMPEP_0179086964 /NCGR_PEP_ID=MMETSP0796-20121207/39484_1 /TAXON_ID=73915 /ORGANISM="Pyrodinium bahamense, Strain pbaha01" /LENGTH=35 /DNA_ID= /DNA_START= /DNA_END= /DNA_ORIENTATION=
MKLLVPGYCRAQMDQLHLPTKGLVLHPAEHTLRAG